jgi:cysteine desulfurase
MSGIAAKTARQASRICAKQSTTTAGLLRAPTTRAAAILGQKVSRRGYVSESKRDNAQVSMDTAVRADQKAFFQETSQLPENAIVGGTNVTADAMMSPMAGMYLISVKRRTNTDKPQAY